MTNKILPQNRQKIRFHRVDCCVCRRNEAIYYDKANRPFCIACFRGEVR